MPRISLDSADATELAELLHYLADWLASDPARLGTSLQDFTGHHAYGIRQMHDDLHRFAFLLGADNGGQLFGPPTA